MRAFRLACALALLLGAAHAHATRAFCFGTFDELTRLDDTRLTDARGHALHLARHLEYDCFLAPWRVRSRGLVLVADDDPERYHDLPAPLRVLELQRRGDLPTPLPDAEPELLERVNGYGLWWGTLIVVGVTWLGTRRAADDDSPA